jgi:hypothetical protein
MYAACLRIRFLSENRLASQRMIQNMSPPKEIIIQMRNTHQAISTARISRASCGSSW